MRRVVAGRRARLVARGGAGFSGAAAIVWYSAASSSIASRSRETFETATVALKRVSPAGTRAESASIAASSASSSTTMTLRAAAIWMRPSRPAVSVMRNSSGWGSVSCPVTSRSRAVMSSARSPDFRASEIVVSVNRYTVPCPRVSTSARSVSAAWICGASGPVAIAVRSDCTTTRVCSSGRIPSTRAGIDSGTETAVMSKPVTARAVSIASARCVVSTFPSRVRAWAWPSASGVHSSPSSAASSMSRVSVAVLAAASSGWRHWMWAMSRSSGTARWVPSSPVLPPPAESSVSSASVCSSAYRACGSGGWDCGNPA